MALAVDPTYFGRAAESFNIVRFIMDFEKNILSKIGEHALNSSFQLAELNGQLAKLIHLSQDTQRQGVVDFTPSNAAALS